MEKRHEINASIFSSAGTYAPTLGVLGAVFGLIAAMSHIDDTDAMAEAIAAAFIATILGIFTGYVLWNPFAKKLKVKSQQEAMIKTMIVTGLLSIQKGDNTLLVKDKLLAMLPKKQQLAYSYKPLVLLSRMKNHLFCIQVILFLIIFISSVSFIKIFSIFESYSSINCTVFSS